MAPITPARIKAAPNTFLEIMTPPRAGTHFTMCGHGVKDYAVIVTVGLPKFGWNSSRFSSSLDQVIPGNADLILLDPEVSPWWC